jgi:hypothetical protein
MTTPDELERAVERAKASLAFWVDRHGYADAHLRAEDLRLLLSERAELLAAVERMRGAMTLVLPAMEWADAHIGGRTKYENPQQVVNCLEAHDDALDALRAALTTGEANHKDKP